MHKPSRLSQGLIAAGLASGIAPLASAAAFPPLFPLSSLLPAQGGDGSAGFVVSGLPVDGFTGFSVSAAGDVNGDGVDDLIIGSQAVGSFVVFGRDAARVGNFPAILPLANILQGDGSLGFALREVRLDGAAGWTVSAAGDVNGDGIDDLLIGSPFIDLHGHEAAGATYVVYGRSTGFPAAFALERLLPEAGGDGSEGFLVLGIGLGDFEEAGRAVSAAGDINHDGIGDLIIGSFNASLGANASAGASYVLFGRDSAGGDGFPPVVSLASLLSQGGGDGSAGFVLTGIAANDRSGWAVSDAGDMNGDGIDDLAVSAPFASPRGHASAGETYVIFGRDVASGARFPPVFPLARLAPGAGGDGSQGFVLLGIANYDEAGLALSAAGDVNGDGLDDLVIAAPYADPSGRAGAGESFVVFGRDVANGGFPAAIALAQLLPPLGGDGSGGFVLSGVAHYDEAGMSVSAAGDINGDGIADIVIGAPFVGPRVGQAYVIFGRDTAQSGEFAAVLPLAGLLPAGGGDGSAGFVMSGVDANDTAGWAVSAAGDVNGDGVGDLIIGAPGVERDGAASGDSYVVFGRSGTRTP